MENGEQERVEIRYSLWKYIFLVAFFCVVIVPSVIMHTDGKSTRSGWVIYIAAAAFLVVLVFQARKVFNRTPVVILDRSGVWDRRIATAVLPWAQIKSAKLRLIIRYGADVIIKFADNFKIPEQPTWQSEIRIDLRGMDIAVGDFGDHIRRFAPHVVIERP